MIEARRPGTNPTFETRGESEAAVNKQKRYNQILEILDHGEMTAKEIAVKMCELGYIPTSERNYTAPRLTELSKNGLVEPVGKKKCEWTNKSVAVYRRCN